LGRGPARRGERSVLRRVAETISRDHRGSAARGPAGDIRARQGAMKRALLDLLLVVTLAPGLFAHEVRPAYLELRQRGPEAWDAQLEIGGPHLVREQPGRE